MKSGLIPPKKELVNLDFSHSRYFGAVSELPTEDFIVAEPLEVKNQLETYTCVAQAITSVSEDQEGIPLESAYTWARIRQVAPGSKQGATPRDACKVATKFGFLPKTFSPYSLEKNGEKFISNPYNWGWVHDSYAAQHKKGAYFTVDGQSDLFDSIMATMWTNRKKKKSVFVGAFWQPWWDGIVSGVIPNDSPYDKVNPHAFKIYGRKTIDGEVYAIALNSYGENSGDRGRFYFPREIVNKFLFAYTFEDDVNPEDVKETWTFAQKLKNIVVKLLKKLL